MNNATRLKRLKQLKYMMENHSKIFPDSKLNMDTWVEPDDRVKCGSSACALGSACFYKPFQKQGLKYNGFRSLKDVNDWNLQPEYKGETDFPAGEKFFGITEDQSHFLFHPERYQDIEDENDFYGELSLEKLFSIKPVQKIKPKHVAKRVGQLIAIYSAM